MTEEILARIDSIRSDPGRRGELVGMLRDSHSAYQGKSAADVVRIRARLMEAFAEVGLPEEARPFVIGDLETSLHAATLVSAARALRAGKASAHLAPILDRAAENARERDEFVSGTTALREIESTRRWLADSATQVADGCCANPEQEAPGFRRIPPSGRRASADVVDADLEDQDGVALSFREMFIGKPALVAFFYTRCENPRKCSLTISKLARAQKLLADRGLSGIRIGAVTYDPAFDTPARLAAYGKARGLNTSLNHRLLRAKFCHEKLDRFFDCLVSRVGPNVSRHGIELFILDEKGRVAVAFEHREWDVGRVVDEVERLSSRLTLDLAGSGLSGSLWTIGVALAPKCPMCWAAYASALGIAGLQTAGPWVAPLLAVLVVLNAGWAGVRARRIGRYLPFSLTVTGAMSVVLFGLALGYNAAMWIGASLTLLATVLPPSIRISGLRRPWPKWKSTIHHLGGI